ncbi:histidine kinase [Flavobacterium sp. K5-23]|uniref:histidine kinase n=1 Tax=Flavobacterium sp. K5-23 TaxID=2746225 RepID=UPI00200DACA5|nr:histidine kinase [Flavobacterium sp. K5-23]UQD55394.1 histidine kinase [Flavobacterium sp. K5-23]
MKTSIRKYAEIARELKVNYPKLTEYEILTLAIQIERNEILENGLVVSSNDNEPSGIEAIAIALGYTRSQ